jgi:hypothetical protein
VSPTSSRRCSRLQRARPSGSAGAVRRRRRLVIAATAALALAACSLVPPAVPEDPARELATVPFFPQTIHQCGPAALATVLQWSGADATPESLAPQVYIPGRKGSLALELIAATRRAGRVPFPLAADADAHAIFAEVRAGTPPS